MTDKRRERLYRIYLSYRVADSDEGRKDLKCEVIASEAARAIQIVLALHQGIDVIVATVEQIAALDDAMRADEE